MSPINLFIVIGSEPKQPNYDECWKMHGHSIGNILLWSSVQGL